MVALGILGAVLGAAGALISSTATKAELSAISFVGAGAVVQVIRVVVIYPLLRGTEGTVAAEPTLARGARLPAGHRLHPARRSWFWSFCSSATADLWVPLILDKRRGWSFGHPLACSRRHGERGRG
jgi:hypothetical protein